jgi:lysophospholipid acyltransferase (LPLAT)-like uncharacterized protein
MRIKDFTKIIARKIISSRVIGGIAVFIAKTYVNLVFLTSKIKCRGPVDKLREHLQNNNAAIIMSWHGEAFILPPFFRNFFRRMNFHRNVNILTSMHEDGKMAAKLIKSFGYKTIYGSSINKKRENCLEKSGAVKSIMEMIREIKKKSVIFLTPDGPRGPYHKINSKIVDIAGEYGVTIFTLGVSYSLKKQFKSWDKFWLPLPFGKIVIEFWEPMHVPKGDDFEKYKIDLEKKML